MSRVGGYATADTSCYEFDGSKDCYMQSLDADSGDIYSYLGGTSLSIRPVISIPKERME